ncbi:MAG: hypothetical protein U1E74_00225 [Paenacidovorax caeni]
MAGGGHAAVGGVVTLLISSSMVQLVPHHRARVALPLVVLSLLWLSWQFLGLAQAQGLAPLWQRQGEGGMGVMPALDLVIAMPISWLPLVADYARHGRSGAGALRGAWAGYAVANIWCYALGVLVALTLPSQGLVTALLLAQGGLIALSLILIDEVDNAYGDVYFGAVSSHSLWPRWGVRQWGLGGVAVTLHIREHWCCPCTAWSPFAAARLSVRAAVWRHPGAPGVGRQRRYCWPAHAGRMPYRSPSGWRKGIACYHLLAPLGPALGSGPAHPGAELCPGLGRANPGRNTFARLERQHRGAAGSVHVPFSCAGYSALGMTPHTMRHHTPAWLLTMAFLAGASPVAWASAPQEKVFCTDAPRTQWIPEAEARERFGASRYVPGEVQGIEGQLPRVLRCGCAGHSGRDLHAPGHRRNGADHALASKGVRAPHASNPRHDALTPVSRPFQAPTRHHQPTFIFETTGLPLLRV